MAPPQTYSAKTFHKDFENTYGYLKPEQFPPIDWADKAQIEMLFPQYKIEMLALAKFGGQLSKQVEIRDFSLRTPNNSADIFKDTKLIIEPAKRCAVFGINGSGKTSLFNAISAGEVKGFPKWMHIHHMKELEHHPDSEALSVVDTILCSHPFRRVLVCMEPHLKNLIAEEEDQERKRKLEENLEYVQQCLATVYGSNALKEVTKMLRVLGFDETGEQLPISALSGGLRMRVAVASAFFINPDLLLLDEPTNHLDMPSVLWLENRLRGYKGSFLLVTHDRILLENVVTSVMLIQDLAIQYYDCGFKEFEKLKELEDATREKTIQDFMHENRGSIDPSDPKYRRRETYREWLRIRAERQMLLAGKFTFSTPAPLPMEGDVKTQDDISLIKVENVRFTYSVEQNLPFIFDRPISYDVKVGTRVGIMGPNGAGKSTFLKLITGKLEATEGTITAHPTYTLAYFGQHSTKELDMQMTPFEFMSKSFPDANPIDLKNHLKKTSISDGPMNTRMIGLSFSQRSCVIFAKLTFVPPHLLIMDEPTNFLDLDSVDALISAVNKFKGGLIVVTHNRDFLRRTGKTFLSIVPGSFSEYGTMKEAERATYSFISALEEGRAIDVKKAIMENRGGGAIHTEEYLAASQQRLSKQQMEAKAKADAKKAEEDRLAKIAAEKEAKRQAKLAAQKLDWAAGDECWAPVGNKFVKGSVLRNVPSMGVSVQLETGKTVMVDAKKLKQECPEPAAAPAAAAPAAAKSAGRGGAAAPRGGARGAAAAGGRGGNAGGRGGRGGSSGRGR